MIFEVLKLKPLGFLSPFLQIALICGLLALAILTQRKEYEKTGKTYGRYPWRISTFLSSIYEEIIFRGLVLFGLLLVLPLFWSVVISSVLFGLWHIKNLKWQTRNETIYQVVYTAVVFGPIASIITLWTGTIWLAVIVHYLHNLLVDEYRKKFTLK